ncbi:uncharacterized protein LOC121648640, partial [Scomber scombrus]
MVKDFTKPAAYTGELIGVEYLYQQTNRVLEEISLDPDTPDEAAAVDALEDVDGGIEVDEEDPTVFGPDTPAAQSGHPADAPRSEPSVPSAPPKAPEVKAPPASSDSSSDSEEEMQGPDGQPAYQHVLKLAKALLEVRSLQGLSDRRVDRLIALWQGGSRLPSQTPGGAAEGEGHLLPWKAESPTQKGCPLYRWDEDSSSPSSSLRSQGPPAEVCLLLFLNSSTAPSLLLFLLCQEPQPSGRGRRLPLPGGKTRRPVAQYACSKCVQPKRLTTGLTRLAGVAYCAAVGGKTVE